MPQWLDYGAGAGQGLEVLLARLRAEELLRQSEERNIETGRSNLADEALRGRQIDENAEYRKAVQASTQQQRDIANRNTETTQGRLRLSRIPADTLMQGPQVEHLIELGSAEPEEFRPEYGPSQLAMQQGAPASLAETEATGNSFKQPTPTEVNQRQTSDRLLDEQNRRDERFKQTQVETWNRMVTQIRAADARFNAFPLQVYDPSLPGGIGWDTRGGTTGGVSSAPPMRPGGIVSGPGVAPPGGAAPGAIAPASQSAGTLAAQPADQAGAGGQGGAGRPRPAAPPPAQERTKLDAYKTTLQLVKEIEKVPDDVWQSAMGLWDANVSAPLFEYGGVNVAGGAEGETLRVMMNKLKAATSFDEGGKQFTGSENALIAGFIANANQNPAAAKVRLREFKQQALRSLGVMGVTPESIGMSQADFADTPPGAAPGAPARRRVKVIEDPSSPTGYREVEE